RNVCVGNGRNRRCRNQLVEVVPRALSDNGLRLRTEADEFGQIRSQVSGNPNTPARRTITLYFDRQHSILNHNAENRLIGFVENGAYVDFNVRIAR
ncbi:MAG: hypothetical protein AAB579_03550, partial [Patescibacteria group bacterium]